MHQNLTGTFRAHHTGRTTTARVRQRKAIRALTTSAATLALLGSVGAAAGVASVHLQSTTTALPAVDAARTTTIASSPTTTAVVGATTAAASSDKASGRTTVVALRDGRAGAKVTVYRTADTSAPLGTLTNGVNVKGRVVFTVIEQQGDWYKVNAPLRPNGAVGYVRASELDPSFSHEWRILIELGARRLTVFKGTAIVDTETIAVGAPKTPTPVGSFYTVDLLKPAKGPKGPYGPFAYGISGFSNVYQKFGAGDGRIGIHGTNEPTKLGKAVSNGCIRMSNVGITKLRNLLPLGVPVEIRA